MPDMGGGGGGIEIDSSEPSTKTAGMIWVDTDSNKTFRRNDDNTAWINLQYVDDGIVLDQSTTYSDFTVPSAVTSVSSTKADAWYTVQSGTSDISTNGNDSSGAGKKSIFKSDSPALGITFVQIKAYTKTSGSAGNFRFYFCKGTGNTAGSNQTYNNTFSPGPSGTATLCTAPSSAHSATTIEAGDYFNLGAYNQYETNGTKGNTGAVTGSEIQFGTGTYGCGATDSGDPSNGQFYLELLQSFASTNLTTAAEGMIWESNAETNPNCVLDWGALKDFGQVALYWGANSTETQVLIQTSVNGSDWTTVRTINSTAFTDDTTNYIRFNLINGRYIRIYGNSGDSKVLAIRVDARINPSLGDHEHIDISSSDTTLPLDGT